MLQHDVIKQQIKNVSLALGRLSRYDCTFRTVERSLSKVHWGLLG